MRAARRAGSHAETLPTSSRPTAAAASTYGLFAAMSNICALRIRPAAQASPMPTARPATTTNRLRDNTSRTRSPGRARCANANLAGAPGDIVCRHRREAERGNDERQHTERHEHRGAQAPGLQQRLENVIERVRVDVRKARRGTLRLAPERRKDSGRVADRSYEKRAVRAARSLLDGNVVGRGPPRRWLNRRKQAGIGNDADNLSTGIVPTRRVETLAYRLLLWPNRSPPRTPHPCGSRRR